MQFQAIAIIVQTTRRAAVPGGCRRLACRCSPVRLPMGPGMRLRGLSPGLLASQGLPSGASLLPLGVALPPAASLPYSSLAERRP